MVSVCLCSDALSQRPPSYWSFSHLGHGVSLHGCSSKAQPLLLALDMGRLLTAAATDLRHGVSPLTHSSAAQTLETLKTISFSKTGVISYPQGKLLMISIFKKFLFLYFCLPLTARGILVPRLGTELKPPVLEAWSPNHRTAGQVPWLQAY